MNVFVLMGELVYEPGNILGVYSSREAARSAALTFEAANRAQKHPTDYDYYIHEIGVDVAASEHIGFDGEFIEVE